MNQTLLTETAQIQQDLRLLQQTVERLQARVNELKDKRLSDKVRTILRNAETGLIIPTIVLAEIKHLSHRGRFLQTLDDVLAVIDENDHYVIYPIDRQVIQNAPARLEIHDSLIVGTALAQADIADGILTSDRAIAASSTVPAIW